jgi:hypothetical protein
MGNSFRYLLVVLAACAAGGCAPAIQPLAMALAGAGTSTAMGHGLNGTAYRTFTAPVADVKAATLDTLSLMGMRVDRFGSFDEDGELIVGSSRHRTVEIELEPISSKATRMRVAARNGGLFYDSSTATEIVLQTEKALVANEGNAAAGASRRSSRD